MSSLTIVQHHRMCVFHLGVEAVPLSAAQVGVQTHLYITTECSNRLPVTRLWPVYKDLELLPRKEEENPVAAFFISLVQFALYLVYGVMVIACCGSHNWCYCKWISHMRSI